MNNKYLLDTHILLWYVGNSKKLSSTVRDIINDSTNAIYYSIVSLWEAEIKRLKHPDKILDLSTDELVTFAYNAGLEQLHLNEDHVRMLKTLSRPKDAPPHSDPFDRILISQAKSEGMIFLTHDVLLPYYSEDCIVYV